MMTIAKWPEFPIKRATSLSPINYYDTTSRDTRQLRLFNEELAKLAQNIERSGFGSLSEVYFDLIAPLSLQLKLPDVSELIDKVQNDAAKFELSQQWSRLVEVCSWLLGFAKQLDPDKDYCYPRAVAICLGTLHRMCVACKLQKSEGRDDEYKLSRNTKALRKMCSDLGRTNLSPLFSSIQNRRERWDKSLNGKASASLSRRGGNFPKSFKITRGHLSTMKGELPTTASQEDAFGWTPLHYAMVQKSSNVSRHYFDLPFPQSSVFCWEPKALNNLDFRGWTMLHYSCLRGVKSITSQLLDKYVEVNVAGSDGVTPMHCAVKSGNVEVLRLLTERNDLQRGQKSRDHNDRAPIHWLAWLGGEDSIEMAKLLESGIGLKDRFGWTCLHLAAVHGHDKLLGHLLKQTGANKDQRDSKQRSPLHLAVEHQRDEAIRVLLAAGADANLKMDDGASPLHIAAEKSNEGTVQVLLAAGADANLKMERGLSPLHIAAGSGNEETARLLLEAGADTNMKMEGGISPLHMAAALPHEKTARVLLAAGADINFKTEDGKSPLHSALECSKEDEVVLRLLIEAGANLGIADKDGKTPLHMAAKSSSKEIIQSLLQRGANTNVFTDGDPFWPGSWAPLQVAIQRGDIEIVGAFADHDKTAEDKAILLKGADGHSPLHILAQCSHPWSSKNRALILRRLLGITPEIDVNVRNDAGKTPLDIALENECQELIDALKQEGASTGEALQEKMTEGSRS